jgi:hypothetical protein
MLFVFRKLFLIITFTPVLPKEKLKFWSFLYIYFLYKWPIPKAVPVCTTTMYVHTYVQ